MVEEKAITPLVTTYAHLPEKLPCPFLPPVHQVLKPSEIRELKKGENREDYYYATLKCAHSLWHCGLPAQALLQLNFSLGEDLPEEAETLTAYPLPYSSVQWILENTPAEEFLGNPVRHYQHLATRMVGRNAPLRTLRAWVCFHLASHTLPAETFPPDHAQLEKEKREIPSLETLLLSLEELQKDLEVKQLRLLMP